MSKKELEKKVEAYAKNHPVKNLVVHAGPVAAMPLGVLTIALLGLAPAFVTIVICASILWFLVGAKSFNKAVAASHDIADPELEVAEKKVKALLESTDIVRPPETKYECPNYEQVTWDMKLVDEKVMAIADVSVCDTDGCLLCTPIKEDQKTEAKRIRDEEALRKAAEWQAQLDEIRKRQEKRATDSDKAMLEAMEPADAERVKVWSQSRFDEKTLMADKWGKDAVTEKYQKGRSECKSCKTGTMFAVYCPKCSLERLKEQDENDRLAKIVAAKAKRAAARAEKKRLFEERRKVNVMGVNILRPLEVPEGAVPSILHGKDLDRFATHSYVVWKWTENGKDTQFYKQPIAIDAYSISSAKGVIKTFYSAHDPETGAYLGDYSNEVQTGRVLDASDYIPEIVEYNKQ